MGMNPLLVDASLKKKLFKRKMFKTQEELQLLKTLEQLEDIGEIWAWRQFFTQPKKPARDDGVQDPRKRRQQ